MNKIADYDTLDYDYRQYWKYREYENEAEKIVLSNFLKNDKGSWFIDIGGSYGRLTPAYYDKYTKSIIVDYSIKTLQKNYEYFNKTFPNTLLIAANAYHLPFKDSTFDGGMMVRVLHHIDKPTEYFREVYRILKHNSIYIQEYANKRHLKAIIKGLLKLNLTVFSKEPYQQPTKDNYEGARKGKYVPFFNYHPTWINDTLTRIGFNIVSVRGCSFFRINILKKILPTNILIPLEKVAQKLLSWSNISPSIFVKCKVSKKNNENTGIEIEDILACPSCKGDLSIKGDNAICMVCKRKYNKEENIWDFRV